MSTGFENLSSTQKARAALHRDVRAITSETCHFLGLEVTRSAMEVIAELVYKKLLVYGTDLEVFAKHAKRSTINSEDVKLLVRRNPSLKAHLSTVIPLNQPAAKEKRWKTVPASRPPETPADKTKDTNSTKTKETDSAKSKDTLAKSKELNRHSAPEEKPDDVFVENMIVDNTIDLTFE